MAHIRHVYTNYERLLRTTTYTAARRLAEQPSLAKLVEWRGDDENGKSVLEDVFREVIVISDDEGDDSEEGDSLSYRDPSVEIISSRESGDNIHVQTRAVEAASLPSREPLQESSVDDAPPGFRFVSGSHSRSKADRKGFTRYQAWNRAVNRFWRAPSPIPLSQLRETPTGLRHSNQGYEPLLESGRIDIRVNGPPTERLHCVPPASFSDYGQGNGPNARADPVRRDVSGEKNEPPRLPCCQAMIQEANNLMLTSKPFGRRSMAEQFSNNQSALRLSEGSSAVLTRVPVAPSGNASFRLGDTADRPIFVGHVNGGPAGEHPVDRFPRALTRPEIQAPLEPQDRPFPSVEIAQAPQSETLCFNDGRSRRHGNRGSDRLINRSVSPSRIPGFDSSIQSYGICPPPVALQGHRRLRPQGRRANVSPGAHGVSFAGFGQSHQEESRMHQYPQAKQWPSQDTSHARRDYGHMVDSRYAAEYQPRDIQDPSSHPTNPSPRHAGSMNQRDIAAIDPRFLHDKQPEHRVRQKEPVQCDGIPNASSSGPAEDYLPIHRAPGIYSGREAHRIPRDALDLERDGFSLGGSPSRIGVPQRRDNASQRSYFVQPVSLHDTHPLDFASPEVDVHRR